MPWGCSLFPENPSNLSSTNKRSLLQPLKASPESILLDIRFLERPADDPVSSIEIWKEIDELGDMKPEMRENLRRNGFRIGHVGSNPPPSIQKLLGLVSEIPSDVAEYAKPIMGRHTYLSPGIESEIPTGISRGECQFVLHEKEGSKTLEYEKVNCVFRMKAFRIQEGWVRIDFQPEIHHGERQMRHAITEQGPVWRGGQNIDALLAHRFDVKMNVGETLIVTSNQDEDETLGDRFFCHEVGGTTNQRLLKKQRILLIHVLDSGKSQSDLSK